MPSQAKNWCFTLNNHTDEDIERIKALGDSVSYLIAGKETGESGTPHLQGFVSFPSRKRLNQVKSIIGSNPHCEVARSVSHSVEYCKKEGDFFEVGDPPAPSGSRSDLDMFKDDVKSGMFSLKALREEHSEILAKYPRFANDYVHDNLPAREFETYPLHPWQQTLNLALNLAPDDRTISFIVDTTGNNGKTWFCYYYQSLHDHVQVMQPDKKANMCYLLCATTRVLFVDAPRSKQGEFIQYDFLEAVKNGYVQSGKYECQCKRMQKCHVVVMMNEMPDLTKLSEDRFNIVEI